MNDSEVDPDFVIDESNSPTEPVAIPQHVKRQNQSGSYNPKVAASPTNQQASVELPSKPLT